MRDRVWIAGVFVATLVLVSCGATSEEAAAPRADDLLYMRGNTGVSMIHAGSSAPTFHSVTAAPDPHWKTVVQNRYQDSSTHLTALIPKTGQELWTRELPGKFVVKVVSPGAHFVALAPNTARYYRSPGYTEIVVVDRNDASPARFELEGNFEPEAFSTDGNSLFVVQYRPAGNPRSYQVRQLDLTSGKVNDVFSVDKELQEEMRGTARVQEMSPDGTRLYTLYTLRTPHGVHSFVHVLALDELWAHCIDLPEGFTVDGESKTGLGVSPDGKKIFVADTKDNAVAELDAQALQVTRTVEMDLASVHGGADLAVSPDGTSVFVASGNRLVAASASDLASDRSWAWKEKIRGIQVGEGGRVVYVAMKDGVIVIDALTGKQLETFDPPNITTIHELGPVTDGLDPARTNLVCGC